MDALSRKMWSNSRRLGKIRFVVCAGIAFSFVACLIFWLFVRLFGLDGSPSLNAFLAFLLICYGPVWSYSFWTAMERKWNVR